MGHRGSRLSPGRAAASPAVATLLLLSLSACGGPSEGETRDALAGYWIARSEGPSGETVTLNVAGNRFSLLGPLPGDERQGRFRLAPDGWSGRISLAVERCGCPDEGREMPGRYELSGAELVLALAAAGAAEPPRGLVPGPGVTVLRFERLRSPARSRPSGAP